MDERFDVSDCDSGRAWSLQDEAAALRYASARHAATGNVVEVVRVTGKGGHRQVFVIPPDAPLGRRLTG